MFNLLRLITHCNVNGNYREEANGGRGLQRSAAACRVLDWEVCACEAGEDGHEYSLNFWDSF